MKYCVWDIETQTHTLFKRKASPWHPDMFIVASGYKLGKSAPVALYHQDRALPEGWFTNMLKAADILVGFNIGFDLLHALQDQKNLVAWMDWIANGGQVWDCQLAEFLLEGMVREAQMLSLNEVAPRYGGSLKVDEVKLLWEAGVQTDEIEKDLLIRYLIGDQSADSTDYGDIGNTEKVFLGQLKKARASGQLRSILLNMGALVGVVEMMRNGMYVDKEKGLALAQEIRESLEAKTEVLKGYLPKDLPFEFNWTNRYHLSPLIFGGTVKYKAPEYVLDDKGNKTYYQKDEVHYLLTNGKTVEVGYWDTMKAENPEAPDEREKNKGGKNKGEPKTKKVKVPDIERGPKTRIGEFLYEFPGFTEPDKAWASSTPGLYSVAADVIEELGTRDIPFLNVLSEVTALSKDLTTYYISEAEDGGEPKGMLTLVGPDGLIHGSINMTNTVTGRFSASNPNLQNIPRGDTSAIKSVFVSRFKDGVIGQSDFKSLEVYIQAMLTGDEQLVADLRNNLDMHCARLATAENMPYEEVLRLCKVEEVPEWDVKRTHIKKFSFQRAYGAGAPKIAAYLKVPVETVEAWIEADNARYPGIDKWYEWLEQTIKRSRKPTQRFLQHPEVPGLTVQLGRGSYQSPTGKLYSWSEVPAPAWQVKRGTMTSFMPTEIRNYPVQGEGGEFMKAALWLLVREFYRRHNFDGQALLINTVHDATYIDAAKDVAYKACVLLHACMEAASDFIEWYFDWKLPVAVPSDTGVGPSMKDPSSLKGDAFKQHTAQVRSYLRAQYMEGYSPSFDKE